MSLNPKIEYPINPATIVGTTAATAKPTPKLEKLSRSMNKRFSPPLQSIQLKEKTFPPEQMHKDTCLVHRIKYYQTNYTHLSTLNIPSYC